VARAVAIALASSAVSNPLEPARHPPSSPTAMLIHHTLLRLMEEREVNQARLAELVNVSPQFITKVMRTNANLTIEMIRPEWRPRRAALQEHEEEFGDPAAVLAGAYRSVFLAYVPD
jgi:hypothetical protein